MEQYEDFGSKSKVFYNYLDEEEIQSLARQEVEIDRECLNIVTVARISYEKGIDLALESAKRLKEKGISFKWYVCGDGVLYGEIKKQVSSERLDDCFILLGEKNNPYPYIKKCDIYVQPSRTEGFCTTTNEAKVLNKVIVTTDVGGMREQFVDRKTALITNINSQAIYEAIMELINSPKFANEIRENLSNTEINFNTSTIHEILS